MPSPDAWTATERPDSAVADVTVAERAGPSAAFAGTARASLDGVYCYCDCAQHSGHYSLLDCFVSDHAARCDICMSEAVIAYRMSMNGATLNAIRAEVDKTYGS